ncbi:MAG: hypothetical protein M3137_15640 [Actinomycetota bacterium]|nr:hypothetical protein [Actinomycetota bacterium]
MSPAVQIALDAYVQAADQLVGALLEALAEKVRERYPLASAIRLDWDWTQDHRLVVKGTEVEDGAKGQLYGSNEQFEDPGWSAAVDELLGCLAEIRPDEMESISLLTLP